MEWNNNNYKIKKAQESERKKTGIESKKKRDEGSTPRQRQYQPSLQELDEKAMEAMKGRRMQETPQWDCADWIRAFVPKDERKHENPIEFQHSLPTRLDIRNKMLHS